MAYTYDELSKLTVAQLREIAHQQEDESLKGVATMHKEKLLPLLCKVLKIDVPHHHVEGIDKTGIKQKIRSLKKERDDILAARRGKEELRKVLDQIHDLKNRLRRHMV